MSKVKKMVAIGIVAVGFSAGSVMPAQASNVYTKDIEDKVNKAVAEACATIFAPEPIEDQDPWCPQLPRLPAIPPPLF